MSSSPQANEALEESSLEGLKDAVISFHASPEEDNLGHSILNCQVRHTKQKYLKV